MSRAGKWAKRIVLGFALLIGLLVLLAVLLNWRAGKEVEKRLQAIRDAGDPVTFADLARPAVDPADNAVTYLRRAANDAESIENELTPLLDEKSYYVADSGRLTMAGAERVQATLLAHPDVIPLLMQAADCQTYISPVDFTADRQSILNAVLEQIRVNRGATRALQRHAESLTHNGQRDEAVQASLVILRIGRLCAEEPLLVSYLVSQAIRGVGCNSIELAIQAGPISDATRQLVETELASQDDLAGYESALKSERVYFIASIRSQFGGPPGLRFVPRFVLNESGLLDLCEAVIKTATRPRYEVSAELAAFEAQSQERGILNSRALTGLAIPALLAARGAADRTQARMRCVRVLVALQAFLEKRPGISPTLDQLDVPPQAKIDPYTGEPLRLKQTDAGWLVYCVGDNLIDDGGLIEQESGFGAGPVKAP